MDYNQRPQGFVVGFIIGEGLAAMAEVNHNRIFKSVDANHAVDEVFSQFVHFFILLWSF